MSRAVSSTSAWTTSYSDSRSMSRDSTRPTPRLSFFRNTRPVLANASASFRTVPTICSPSCTSSRTLAMVSLASAATWLIRSFRSSISLMIRPAIRAIPPATTTTAMAIRASDTAMTGPTHAGAVTVMDCVWSRNMRGVSFPET